MLHRIKRYVGVGLRTRKEKEIENSYEPPKGWHREANQFWDNINYELYDRIAKLRK